MSPRPEDTNDLLRIVLFDVYGSHWQPNDNLGVVSFLDELMQAEMSTGYAPQALRRDSLLVR